MQVNSTNTSIVNQSYAAQTSDTTSVGVTNAEQVSAKQLDSADKVTISPESLALLEADSEQAETDTGGTGIEPPASETDTGGTGIEPPASETDTGGTGIEPPLVKSFTGGTGIEPPKKEG